MSQSKLPVEALPLHLEFAVCGSVSPCVLHCIMLTVATGMGEGGHFSNHHSRKTVPSSQDNILGNPHL